MSNQVLEHVPDLNVALSEIRRVLKPDGVALACFHIAKSGVNDCFRDGFAN